MATRSTGSGDGQAAQPPQALAALQSELAQRAAGWQAAANPISRMSLEEIKRLLGAEPPPGATSFEEREATALSSATSEAAGPAAMDGVGAPPAFDWRSRNGATWVAPVSNQGSCGSCVAFGAVAAVEGSMRVKRSNAAFAVDLSEAHLFYGHAAAEGRNCGNGWWPDRALEAFKGKGVVEEACFPYTPGDQTANLCTDWQNRLTKITAWRSLRTAAEMKTAISGPGPLVGCFVVYDDFPSYSSGIYRRVSNTRLGGHCVCIVGYDDAARCWIAKNSWGSAWGEQGYFRIGYGEVGIDFEMWAVDVPAAVEDTALWLKNKTITGLWIAEPGRNAAAFIEGVGWKKLVDSDAAFQGLLTLLAGAKASRSPCNLRIEGGLIRELYVF